VTDVTQIGVDITAGMTYISPIVFTDVFEWLQGLSAVYPFIGALEI
jgi:hypothetical protein